MSVPELPDVVNLAVPGFIALILVELAAGRLRQSARYETRDTFASLTMGVGNLVAGILLGGVVGAAYFAAAALAPFPLAEQPWGWSWPVFALCFILDDLRYYWFHRISHESRWFWASHVNHHSSQHYNLSTALRQSWTNELSVTWIFHLPLLVLGFHPAMLAFCIGLNLIYQFWIHTEAIDRFPRWFEAVFNTPSHHRVHHATNPRYLDANYAGAFIVWDRMFGTFVPELRAEDPPRYGLVKNIATFNPLRIALHEWIGMLGDVLRPGLSLRDRLGYLLGPPGWSHDQSRKTSTHLKADFVARNPDQAGTPGLPGAA